MLIKLRRYIGLGETHASHRALSRRRDTGAATKTADVCRHCAHTSQSAVPIPTCPDPRRRVNRFAERSVKTAAADDFPVSMILRLVGQEQAVGDDFALQRPAAHLETAQHRSTNVHEEFPFEQTVGNRQIAKQVA
jgi:hypothetical protein